MFRTLSVKILRFASQAISIATLGYHVTDHYLLSLLMEVFLLFPLLSLCTGDISWE